MLGSTAVTTAALLCPSLPYVILLHPRTAALLLFCCFSTYFLHTEDDTAPICFVRHTGRQQAYFGSATSNNITTVKKKTWYCGRDHSSSAFVY